jgi:hypothetical protein
MIGRITAALAFQSRNVARALGVERAIARLEVNGTLVFVAGASR